MMANPLIRSVLRMAIGLLVLLTIGGALAQGNDFGAGVMMGGVVMLLSFMLGGRLVSKLSDAASAGVVGGGGGVAMVKLPVLVLAIWALVERFDPLAVVLGGSVVTIAIVLVASGEVMRQVPEETA